MLFICIKITRFDLTNFMFYDFVLFRCSTGFIVTVKRF